MSTDVQDMHPKIDVADKQSRRRSKDTEKAHWRSSNFQNKKFKHDHKFRKRSQTSVNGKFFPPYKIRKDFRTIIPPTKFLLGGNINDPLNLKSLQDEDINRAMNAVTPKSSPLPTPRHRKGEIEVIIPPDITDPLNLIAGDDDATYEAMLTSPVKRTQKRQKKGKKRKGHRSSGAGSGKEDSIEGAKLDSTDPIVNEVAKTEDSGEANVEMETEAAITVPKEPQVIPVQKRKLDGGINRGNLRKMELKDRKAEMDKIVSPVIPQPGAWNDRHRLRPKPQRTPQIKKGKATPKFKEGNSRFQYGNYTRYYGYRNPNATPDSRLKVLEKRKHFFKGKDVLDIGCNTGHVTLAIAKEFGPNKVVGLDIDRSLIQIARKNIKHYVNVGKKNKFFPVSMPIVYGPIDVPGFSTDNGFPNNVSFVVGNYVLENDILLSMEQPQFDVILCLSITKWIHLNFGDAGLKRAFKRMYAQLRPGGVLILEAQSWSSYNRKKHLTPETWKNYHNTELFPHQFTPFLLNEVGFSSGEVIGSSINQSKGFQRPIKIFVKENPSFDTPVYRSITPRYYRDTPSRIQPFDNSSRYFSGESLRFSPVGTPNFNDSPESGFSEGLHHLRSSLVDDAQYQPVLAPVQSDREQIPNLSDKHLETLKRLNQTTQASDRGQNGDLSAAPTESSIFTAEHMETNYLLEDCAATPSHSEDTAGTPSHSGESRSSSGNKYEELEEESINLSSSGSISQEVNSEANADKLEDDKQEKSESKMEISNEGSEVSEEQGESRNVDITSSSLDDEKSVKTISSKRETSPIGDFFETPTGETKEELLRSDNSELKESELNN